MTARQTNTNKTRPQEKTETDQQPEELKHLPVIGIGASAGGLEALENFFANANHKTSPFGSGSQAAQVVKKPIRW